MSSTRICLFCDRPANSREHVFPDWINAVLPPEQVGPVTSEFVEWVNGHPTTTRTFPTGKVAGQRARVVCSPCNGDTQRGWMCDLESDTASILKPMVLGNGRRLSAAEQILLATWATKTAMVGESIMGHPHQFPREDRFLIREQHRPPLRARVVMAAVVGVEVATRYVRTVADVARDGEPFAQAHLHTLQVGAVVFQVRATHSFPARDNRSLEHVAVPHDVEIPLFPPAEGDTSWPPTVALDEKGFGLLTTGGIRPPVPPPSGTPG